MTCHGRRVHATPHTAHVHQSPAFNNPEHATETNMEALMLNERVNRLLEKAEQAADRGDLDAAETFRTLAGHAAYLNRKEARDMERTLAIFDIDTAD